MPPAWRFGPGGVTGWVWCLGAHLLHHSDPAVLCGSATVSGAGWTCSPVLPGVLLSCRVVSLRWGASSQAQVPASPRVLQLCLLPCVSFYFWSVLSWAPCPCGHSGFALPVSLQRLAGQGAVFAEILPLIQSERKGNFLHLLSDRCCWELLTSTLAHFTVLTLHSAAYCFPFNIVVIHETQSCCSGDLCWRKLLVWYTGI